MADIRQRIVIDAVDNTSKGVKSAQRNANALQTTLTRLRATLLGFVGISIGLQLSRSLIRTSDEAVELTARLKVATNGAQEFTEAFDTLYKLSTQTGTSFEANITLFNRLKIALASTGTDAQSLALNLTEVLNNGLRVSGASAQESASTIRQFSQAMASGVLRGEEFNAIMENSPRIVQALTDSLGKGVGELRAMSKEGLLTSDLVTTALLEQQEAIRKQALTIPITIGRSFENLNTAFTAWLTTFKAGNATVAGGINTLAENFDKVAEAAIIAAKALTILYGGKIVASIAAQGAAIAANAQAELTAAAASEKAAAKSIAVSREKIAIANLEYTAKLRIAQGEAKAAANRALNDAKEKVAAAQREVRTARALALVKQTAAAEKQAATQRAFQQQAVVIAEKEAAVAIKVEREKLRQVKAANAAAEALQEDARQLDRLETLAIEKRATLEEIALRERARQEAAFDAEQRKLNAAARKAQRAADAVGEAEQLVRRRREALEFAEIKATERELRITLAAEKKKLAADAVVDNAKETLSIREQLAALGASVEVERAAITSATATQQASLKKAEAKLAEARAIQTKVAAGEAEQVQTREGFALDQQAVVAAQASVAATISDTEAKAARIKAAQKLGITVAELAAQEQKANVVTTEGIALDTRRIAAVEKAAQAEVAAARLKQQSIALAARLNISRKEAIALLQAEAVAGKAALGVDKQAVLAATEKARADLASARAARTDAAAQAEAAAATKLNTKAKFEIGVETKSNILAQQLLTQKLAQQTVAREANNAATAAGTVAMGANTAATGLNAATQIGLGARLKGILGTNISLTGAFARMGGSGNAAFALLGRGLGSIVGVIGRIGSAILGWPGIIAYVIYEIVKKFTDFDLLLVSFQYAIERVGVAFANMFRGSEASEKAIADLQEEFSLRVDKILEDREAQAAGFENAAAREVAAEQDRKDQLVRFQSELVKKQEEAQAKRAAIQKQNLEYADEAKAQRATQLTETLASLDAEAEAEKTALANKLVREEDFAAQAELIDQTNSDKKAAVQIAANEEELRIAQQQVDAIKELTGKGNAEIEELYADRLGVQREANAALVESVQAALNQAAAAERGYVATAKNAAEARKNILKDFSNFKYEALNNEGSAEDQYYSLSRQRREANAQIREADRLKEAGEFEAAGKLYEEAYDDLKDVASGFQEVSKDSEASRGQQELARLSMLTTITETGNAASKIAEVQGTIEKNATANAEKQAASQQTLTQQLQTYRGELAALDEDIARQREVEITVNGQQAINSLKAIDEQIKKLSQAVVVRIRYVDEKQVGGPVLQRAAGGDVPGQQTFKRRTARVPGTGSGDKIPAMLEPGEFIIRKSAVQKLGTDTMRQINKGQIPGFKRGGFLGKDNDKDVTDGKAPSSRIAKGFAAILKRASGHVAELDEFKRNYKPNRLASPAKKKQDFDRYNMLNYMAAWGKYIGEKLGNVDSSKLDRKAFGKIQYAVKQLLVKPRTKTYGGTNSALKLLGEQMKRTGDAKAMLQEILSSTGAGGFSTGGMIRKFAEGGKVPGFGTGDTVRARLTPGEFVMNRQAVDKMGAGFFENVNRGAMPRKYATGGMVNKANATTGTNKTMTVNLNMGGASASGTFDDNAATRNLLSQLNAASLTAG